MSVVPGCNKWYFTSCFQVSYFSASFLGVAVYIREKKLRVWARGRAKTPNWSVIWFLGQSLEGKPQQLKIEWRQKILEYNQPISKDKNNHLLKCVAGLLGFRSVKMKVPFFNRNKWLEAVDRSFSCPPNRKTPEFWSLTSSFFWVSSLFLVINNFNFIVFQFQKTHLEAITHNFTPCVFFRKLRPIDLGGTWRHVWEVPAGAALLTAPDQQRTLAIEPWEVFLQGNHGVLQVFFYHETKGG